MNDWKKESTKSTPQAEPDYTALAIIAAALIRSGTTKSAVPREAVIILMELKKAYAQGIPEHK